MDEAGATCGGAVAGSIFGTIICIVLLAIGAWFLYKKYWKNKSGKQKQKKIAIFGIYNTK